jgi:hypothetical protein
MERRVKDLSGCYEKIEIMWAVGANAWKVLRVADLYA